MAHGEKLWGIYSEAKAVGVFFFGVVVLGLVLVRSAVTNTDSHGAALFSALPCLVVGGMLGFLFGNPGFFNPPHIQAPLRPRPLNFMPRLSFQACRTERCSKLRKLADTKNKIIYAQILLLRQLEHSSKDLLYVRNIWAIFVKLFQ
jgi:hypothetical protein